MQGLKSAILAIFQTRLGWLCTVSAARDNYMHFTGYVLQHGDPPHFLWGKYLQCRFYCDLIQVATTF